MLAMMSFGMPMSGQAWAVWAVSIHETNVIRHMATPQSYVLEYSVNYTM
jgi:hypothetical protein